MRYIERVNTAAGSAVERRQSGGVQIKKTAGGDTFGIDSDFLLAPAQDLLSSHQFCGRELTVYVERLLFATNIDSYLMKAGESTGGKNGSTVV